MVQNGAIPTGRTILQIVAGGPDDTPGDLGGTTCAIASDYQIYCWGRNDLGQLGDNTTTDRHTPVAIITADISGSKASGLTVQGMTKLVRTSDNATWRSYKQTLKYDTLNVCL